MVRDCPAKASMEMSMLGFRVRMEFPQQVIKYSKIKAQKNNLSLLARPEIMCSCFHKPRSLSSCVHLFLKGSGPLVSGPRGLHDQKVDIACKCIDKTGMHMYV